MTPPNIAEIVEKTMIAPRRAHIFKCDAGGDTAQELAWLLRNFADRIERGDISVGCTGGSSSGGSYAYDHDPSITHESYFAAVDLHLQKERTS